MKHILAPLLAGGLMVVGFSQGLILKWDQMDARDTYGAASWIDRDTPSDALTADDFLCKDPLPIVKVKFAGWSYYGSVYIKDFVIKFWTDVPATPNDASHPGSEIWSVRVNKAAGQGQVGWWELGNREFEAIFRPDQYFYQQGSPTNPQVYWISIQGDMVDDGFFDAYYWYFRQRDRSWNDDAAFTSIYFNKPPWHNWGVPAGGNPSLYDGPLPSGWTSLDMYFQLYAIPEPGTIAALGAGLVGLLAFRRRK